MVSGKSLNSRASVSSPVDWDSHSLLGRQGAGIFSTWGSNLGLLHCRQILYLLSHQGSPGNFIGFMICFSIMWFCDAAPQMNSKKIDKTCHQVITTSWAFFSSTLSWNKINQYTVISNGNVSRRVWSSSLLMRPTLLIWNCFSLNTRENVIFLKNIDKFDISGSTIST